MITIEDKLINVYYVLDEELKKLNHGSHKNSKFTDTEMLTLGVSKELIDKDFYNLTKNVHGI